MTLRAIGPSTPRVASILVPGVFATRPKLGRMPTMPQKLAGLRSEPPISEPCATHAMPVASATAAPPEEPAADFEVFQGFSVAPNTSLNVFAPAPNSGVFDFAYTIAPDASRCSTSRFDFAGTLSAWIGEPKVVRTPATSTRSLIGTGSPASTPRASTGRRMRSSAAARARSKHSVGSAFTAGSTAAMRASSASSRSCGRISSRRSRRTTSVASMAMRSSLLGTGSLLTANRSSEMHGGLRSEL